MGGDVVAAIDINKLKEYGIAGEDAESFFKKYSKDYLLEKIETIEYKKSCGDDIRNIGGMLKKAIIGDWQPPPGFTTRAQREEEDRRRKADQETAEREAREKTEREKREHDRKKMVGEWRKKAPPGELEAIKERARREIMAEYPEEKERWMGPMFKAREDKIIGEEYAEGSWEGDPGG